MNEFFNRILHGMGFHKWSTFNHGLQIEHDCSSQTTKYIYVNKCSLCKTIKKVCKIEKKRYVKN